MVLSVSAAFVVGDQQTAGAQDKTDKTDKKAKEAKITKVDVKNRTATVKMPNKTKDKDVETTFKLAEDIEYMDSTGKVATIEIFTSGDLVLIVERDGMISKMTMKTKSETKKKTESK
jgi:hypothetical protein